MNNVLLRPAHSRPENKIVVATVERKMALNLCLSVESDILIFSYIRRLGSIFGVQKFEFFIFFGVFRK